MAAPAPMRFSYSIQVVVVILLLTIGAGFYVDVQTDRMHARHLEINTDLERMVRLDQALSSMLMISVLEQNTLHTASYDTVNAELEATINAILTLTRAESLSDELAALREDRRQLQATEQAALQLMQQERWREARALLQDDRYVMARKMAEIDSETAIGALTGELATQAARFDRLRRVMLGMRLAALALLLAVGATFSRRLRRELAEQMRLRREIAAVNLELEHKVRERTAELQVANQKLEALSLSDPLTGLPNRRRFDAVWDSQWQRAMRQGQTLALAMIDVDQFKGYNDAYGHQAGDACLQTVAHTLSAVLQRAGDLVARYGGEEFVVILPDADRAQALAMAERMRARVQAQGLTHAGSRDHGVVTVSVGVAACVPQRGDLAHRLLREADAALYRAKQAGRNRVVLAD